MNGHSRYNYIQIEGELETGQKNLSGNFYIVDKNNAYWLTEKITLQSARKEYTEIKSIIH